jgi:bacteriorhodopsin
MLLVCKEKVAAASRDVSGKERASFWLWIALLLVFFFFFFFFRRRRRRKRRRRVEFRRGLLLRSLHGFARGFSAAVAEVHCTQTMHCFFFSFFCPPKLVMYRK